MQRTIRPLYSINLHHDLRLTYLEKAIGIFPVLRNNYLGLIRYFTADSRDGLELEFAKNVRKINISQIYLRSLAARGMDQAGSLFVYTNKENYLFNCGDGTPRICYEFDSILDKERNFAGLFITSNNWDNISGVISLQLIMKEHNPNVQLNIFCPQGLKNSLMPIFKQMVNSKGDKVFNPPNFHEIINEDEILEQALSIRPIPIFLSHKKESVIPRNVKESNYILAYECQARNNIKKVISLEKLVHFDVPPGPLINELKNGSSVVLANGSVVHPEDVTTVYGDKGKSFIVLEIPSKNYLDPLALCQSFDQYRNVLNGVIVHLSPDHVVKDEKYLKWMSSFPNTVSHMVINNQKGGYDLPKSSAFQRRLNQFLPAIFPEPFIEADRDSDTIPYIDKLIKAKSGDMLTLRPHIHFNSVSNAENTSKILTDGDDRKFLDLRNKLMAIKNLEQICNRPSKNYPHINFLGTVSSSSSAYRNESSILVHVNEDNCIMLDCGPGTLYQLFRQFGVAGTNDLLSKLKLIFISHRHSDHILGLNTIVTYIDKIKKSSNLCNKISVRPLLIMAEPQTFKYLNSLHCFITLDLNIEMLNNASCLYNSKDKFFPHDILSCLGFSKLETTFVPHCRNSFAIAFTHKSGWKLVYSGDTLPSEELIKIGKNCDILIHEATFQDSLRDQASYKKHCTVSQAVDVAKRMNAKNVILTHFSQRYSKIPVIENELPGNVCIAFDHMKVTKEDVPYLSHFYHILKELYIEEYDSLMNKISIKEDRKIRNRLKENKKPTDSGEKKKTPFFHH